MAKVTGQNEMLEILSSPSFQMAFVIEGAPAVLAKTITAKLVAKTMDVVLAGSSSPRFDAQWYFGNFWSLT